MPRIDIAGRYRFFFYSSDCDEAPHVDVRNERRMAKLWLDADVSIARNDGFPARDLRLICRLVQEHRQILLAAWREHCG